MHANSTKLNISKECQEHFYPTSDHAATEIASKPEPLSLFSLSGMFSVFVLCSCVSIICFAVEVVVSRMSKQSDSKDMLVPFDVVISVALDFTDDCSLFEQKLDEFIVISNGSYELLDNEYN